MDGLTLAFLRGRFASHEAAYFFLPDDSISRRLTPEQMSNCEALKVKIQYLIEGDERYERKS